MKDPTQQDTPCISTYGGVVDERTLQIIERNLLDPGAFILRIGFSTKDVKDALLGKNTFIRSTGVVETHEGLNHVLDTGPHIFLLKCVTANAILRDTFEGTSIKVELWEKRQ